MSLYDYIFKIIVVYGENNMQYNGRQKCNNYYLLQCTKFMFILL